MRSTPRLPRSSNAAQRLCVGRERVVVAALVSGPRRTNLRSGGEPGPAGSQGNSTPRVRRGISSKGRDAGPSAATSSSVQLGVPAPAGPPPPPTRDPVLVAKARRERFTKLVELRALYRDVMRAKALLRLPAPVYQAPERGEDDADEGEAALEREAEEQRRRKEAVDIVGEMLLTADQLKCDLRTLPPGFGDIFTPGAPTPATELEARVRDRARTYIAELRERLVRELPQLPFPTLQAAQAALEARNARYSRDPRPSEGPSSPLQPSAAHGAAEGAPAAAGGPAAGPVNGNGAAAPVGPAGLLPGGQEAAQQLANSIERLGQAEKVAEKFVVTRIKPVLRKAREGELVDMVKETGQYLQGLWIRLNGGGSRLREPALPPDLPLPASTRKETELAISELSLEVDALEAKLKEAARAREAKLRRMRAPEGRATMPFQLKVMDEEVLRVSRALAVRMLQIEMEYAYASLEDEALDIGGADSRDVLPRQGSTSELRVLAAEFAYLEEQLAALAVRLDCWSGSGGQGGSGGGVHGSGGGSPGPQGLGASRSAARDQGVLSVIDVDGLPVSVEELLAALAVEVPDMRQRAGVPDQIVFGGQGFTLTKARLQARDALDKLREAVTFLTRGVKLLGSDVSTAARLFGRAAVGGTLRPREVSALRRTARDLLTFIPFTIILIIPLTPLGHVLVFGFIQTYFPSFFPSCFTSKRQDMMIRYEELERQLRAARSQAEAVEEEAELVRAAAAMASRLSGAGTPPPPPPPPRPSPDAAAPGPPEGREGAGADDIRAGRPRPQPPVPQLVVGGGSWQDLTALDAVASVAVAEQTAQVRALEERIAAVLDDVTLGDDEPVGTEPGGRPQAGTPSKKRL